jgi:tagatose-1,6-bisphosphate aldolase
MKGLGQIIAENARAAGKEALAFTVYVTVDPIAIANTLYKWDDRSPEQVVADEIASNLESVHYVESITVRRKKT